MLTNEIIRKEVFTFLTQLKNNNNREWFATNKTAFKSTEAKVKLFYNAVMSNLNRHDQIEKLKMFRIYRDVRFSKDKTPYKEHFAGSFIRMGVERRGGYYVRLKPGESFIATGFWEPNKEDLLRIRKELELDASEFRGIIEDSNFKNTWGNLQGDALKTAPKGFNKEHENIDLLRQKQFIFIKKFTDKEVLSKDFFKEVDTAFQAIKPFFDLMSAILTTNLNGESLID